MPPRKWQQFKLPQVLNFKRNFRKEILKIPKILMKKCLKMVQNLSGFLFYSHDCMLNILNIFCIITIGVEL